MVQPNGRRAQINGADLEYWDIGSGPPILISHGGMGDECAAILEEPALTSRFRLIHWQRRGYGTSSCPSMPVSIEQHGADALALLDSLGIFKAHFAGQSYGGAVSLQIALAALDRVHSLALIEPAVPNIVFQYPQFAELAQKAVGLYGDGQGREAVELFARAVSGEDLFPAFAKDWLERWYPDAKVLFESDLPSQGEWSFGEDDASKIGGVPVLNLYGSQTPEAFQAIARAVSEWFPQAETHSLPDTSHPVMQMSPAEAAALMADFFDRHPIQ